MELTFDHLGLVVADLATGRTFLQQTLAISEWTPPTHDDGLKVSVQFGTDATRSLVYELIAPLGDDSPVATALRSNKNILNHVAYLTADLSASATQLRAAGCHPTGGPQPAVAYGGHLIQFFVSPLRFLIELIEKPGHQHPFTHPEETDHA
jgi:methylmalonyl-CoA/ethylmalonyl-CoA epimerase